MTTVYLETSFISKMFDTSKNEISKSFRKIANLWWEENQKSYDFYISQYVIDELSAGIYGHKIKSLKFAKKIKALGFNDEIFYLAEKLIELKAMPRKGLDSLHLACASYYEIDYLLSFNYKHIVNDNKMDFLRKTVKGLKYELPKIVSPERLLKNEKDT